MAVVSFTSDITRQNDLDTSATTSNIGGGPAPGILSALRYQGTNCLGRRVGTANTDYGFYAIEGTSRDTTAAAFRTFGFKGFISQAGDLNANGMRLRLGDTNDTTYFIWTMGDDGTLEAPGFSYPKLGGFVVSFVDATLRAWIVSTVGTPDETAIDRYAITVNISSTSNGENLSIDSLDWVENGIYLVGGDGINTPGNFTSFVDEDEGEGSASFDRVGLWQTRAGVLFFYGRNTIGANSSGTAITTEFSDSFKTLVAPGGFVREGFNALAFDIRNSSTIIDLSNITLNGQGRAGTIRKFDAGPGGDVNTTTDEINYRTHGYETGEQILYSTETGIGEVVTLIGGESKLVTGTTGAYYYAINVDNDNFGVATTFDNALATTKTALATGNGIHSFTRTPDTRPDFEVISNATGGTLDIDACSFVGLRNITLGTGCTFSNTSIVASHKMYLDAGVLDTCTIVAPTTAESVSFIEAETLDNISDCTFTAGDGGGHAIEIISTGTYSFNQNTFNGYSGNGSVHSALYNNSAGAVVINAVGGGGLTYNNGPSATTTINNAVNITVTVVDEAGAAIEDAAVAIYQTSDDTQLMNELTTAAGIATETFNYSTDTAVIIRVRKSSAGSTRYFDLSTTGTITSLGLTVTAVLIEDQLVSA